MASDFRHYKVLNDQLMKFTDEATRNKVLNGMDYVKSSSKPEIKAKWASEVIRRMDDLIDKEICIKVREGCACLMSNEKSIYAQLFRKLRKQNKNDDEYINQVIQYLNNTQPLRRCGDVKRNGDVIYSTIANGKCGCTVIRESLSESISSTWCHCCKGSLLSVYKYVYSEKDCKMDIVETIASGGETCTFITSYL